MPTPDLQGVHKRSLLRDNVFESIRDAIVDGTFTPGERLKDTELEAWLGVSRTPIREALLRLERAGLVVAMPGKATIVAPYDLASTVNAQQVVAAMHELAARLAVPVVTDAAISTMVTANTRFEKALERLDIETALSADDEFHAVFISLSGNDVIQEVLEQTTPVIRRIERMRFGSFAGRHSVAQHATIIEHTRRGDAEATAIACRENWLSLRFTLSQ
ncbi:GntR family transcriptional regulator [Arthrobacter sp. PAMC25284]|uniref:GntR family transcriptional regulator n=1 Tax=Arthrobacter sp. PAMC25284 TaxID=2861279 RepID=UPI001C630A79|nr:GntR family transcriptional regulator [Arthrobacter sp. PAMC25284]QYF91114.1 GntR family transcriptional regulator [Arthrobacter sp. PAMC25284]